MNLPPHLLDQWLAKYAFSETPLPYNLASSTGPCLTVAEVLALGGGCDVGDVVLSYGPPQGHRKLREAIADFYGVDPDWVVVTTGASEALSILFCLASAPGAEIALPNLQFPAFDPLAGAWGLKARHYALEKEDGFIVVRHGRYHHMSLSQMNVAKNLLILDIAVDAGNLFSA